MSKHTSKHTSKPTSKPTSKHRATELRPRYGRLGAAGASLMVTLIAVMGGFGLLPVSSGQANASDKPPAGQQADRSGAGAASDHDAAADERAAYERAANERAADERAAGHKATEPKKRKGAGVRESADATESKAGPKQDTALPEGSGQGKRVVFSESRQRVWLVNEDGSIARTYLVSGSIYDNLDTGAFNVYSRSEDAWGVDDSGSMKYFVRFTQGDTGAAIGFHDIPVKDGAPAQSESLLGTPQSHGCIRQRRSDAVALWEFAPLGTSVIVTA